MPSLDELLATLGRGRTIPIKTRQGGGLGDPTDPKSAAYQQDGFAGVTGATYYGIVEAPAIDQSFDASAMMPFVSSNVEGGYFRRYVPEDQDPNTGRSPSGQRGDLYLLFQKRRPEVPGGRPIGPPRAYVYQNVAEWVWEALLGAASPGGVVWDVIRHGGIPGDRI
jgi:hypothetical protein